MSPAPPAGRLRLGFFLLAGLVFFVLPAMLSLAVDWHWFSEVGYWPVLALSITARSVVGAAVFALAAGWLMLNLRVGWQALAEDPVSFTTREGFTVALPSRAQLRPLAIDRRASRGIPAGLLRVQPVAHAAGLVATRAVRQPGPHARAGPAFYIYTLPVLELVRNLGLALVVLAAIGSAALYVLAGHLAMTPFGPRIGRRVLAATWRGSPQRSFSSSP